MAPLLELEKVKKPGEHDLVYKDEYLVGIGRDELEKYYERTKSSIYLHIKRDKIEKETVQGDGPERKVTKLAIGIEGGFEPDLKSYEVKETFKIVVLPQHEEYMLPNESLPSQLLSTVEAVLKKASATKVAEMQALSGTWDGEIRQVSVHAPELAQLNNGKKIKPSGWKCEECQLESNLWLNLTDGAILCGRKFHDGTGGNEHALNHYKRTGYPLAVKLGTITKEGKGDVYSYPEDDMVEDPYLIKHLAHFGINIQSLEKTDVSMAEMELDLNQKYGEWAAMQEATAQLEPVYGPGYTGLQNMGNSCYLNSVMQVIFTIPDFIKHFYGSADHFFESVTPDETPLNFNVQMAKLSKGLLSGKYSIAPQEGQESKFPPIAPRMFKNVIGRGHPDFSTKNQQDAHEFFLHLLTTVQRACRGREDPTECFKLQVEDRFECGTTGKVKYTYRTEYCLPLPIHLPSIVNKDEYDAYMAKKESGQKLEPNELVRPHIPFEACLEAFRSVENIEQFYSSAINDKTSARKTTRLATFPDYLVIHLKKFMMREDWVPIKLDVSVGMPETLDLSCLSATGLQPHEEPLPEIAAPVPAPSFDMGMLKQLEERGFPLEAAKKAVYFTKNQGLELAFNWLLEHIADPDFSDPFVVPGTEATKTDFVPNAEALDNLKLMGFNEIQATKALKNTANNLDRAVDWIFSHAAELDQDESDVAQESSSSSKPTENFRNGKPEYRLFAFISHMGSSSLVGHYVCHILKDNRWTIFNDEKVAYSEAPPKNLGYLYFYQRI